MSVSIKKWWIWLTAVVFFLGVLGVGVLWKLPHFALLAMMEPMSSIPVSEREMEIISGVPIDCGCLIITLPADQALSAAIKPISSKGKIEGYRLKLDELDLAIFRPGSLDDPYLKAMSAIASRPDMTPIEVEVESYHFSTDDFSFFMSRQAVREFHRRWGRARLFRMGLETKSVDVLSGENKQLLVRWSAHAFDGRIDDYHKGRAVGFRSVKVPDKLDREAVRQILASVDLASKSEDCSEPIINTD